MYNKNQQQRYDVGGCSASALLTAVRGAAAALCADGGGGGFSKFAIMLRKFPPDIERDGAVASFVVGVTALGTAALVLEVPAPVGTAGARSFGGGRAIVVVVPVPAATTVVVVVVVVVPAAAAAADLGTGTARGTALAPSERALAGRATGATTVAIVVGVTGAPVGLGGGRCGAGRVGTSCAIAVLRVGSTDTGRALANDAGVPARAPRAAAGFALRAGDEEVASGVVRGGTAPILDAAAGVIAVDTGRAVVDAGGGETLDNAGAVAVAVAVAVTSTGADFEGGGTTVVDSNVVHGGGGKAESPLGCGNATALSTESFALGAAGGATNCFRVGGAIRSDLAAVGAVDAQVG
jgi:hypothetical protein